MRELEKSFIGKGQVKGFMFTQVQKNRMGYIYKVEDNNCVWYEVFERKENTRFKCVSYPSNKAFGLWAFTYKRYADAYEKLVDIFEKKAEKEALNGF